MARAHLHAVFTAISCASQPVTLQMSSAASSQSDWAFSASWQAADPCANASQRVLQSATEIWMGPWQLADLSQTCLQDASFAELPPLSSLPHAASSALAPSKNVETKTNRVNCMFPLKA